MTRPSGGAKRPYEVRYTPAALKELGKLDKQMVRRIHRFFDETLDLTDPRSRGKALHGRDEWRYRVGDCRILCHLEDRQVVVLVVKVAHRRDVYR